MQNNSNNQMPRYDITIQVEPPSENKDYGPPSGQPVTWTSEHYAQYNGGQSMTQGYPMATPPQAIPRIDTAHAESYSSLRHWDARSPASSESGSPNPNSPYLEHGNDDFFDNLSDQYSDSHSQLSDVQYQENAFEQSVINGMMANLATESQSPQNGSFQENFLPGPEPFQFPMSSSAPNPNHFSPTLQYPAQFGSNQASPTSAYDPAKDFITSDLNTQFRNGPSNMPPPTHHRSSSDYLLPPSPISRRGARSHSRGPGLGHRSTISEGHFPKMEELHPDSPIYFHDDRGRGLGRAKTAPTPKVHVRGKSPYDRPISQNSQNGIHTLEIPVFTGSPTGSVSDFESPSPSSAKDIVATDAMVEAAKKRRTREAHYKCTQCSGTFTTENSRKRHELSHSGLKPYTCSVVGCGQTFSNDDDRKRHENKSKKHAQPPHQPF